MISKARMLPATFLCSLKISDKIDLDNFFFFQWWVFDKQSGIMNRLFINFPLSLILGKLALFIFKTVLFRIIHFEWSRWIRCYPICMHVLFSIWKWPEHLSINCFLIVSQLWWQIDFFFFELRFLFSLWSPSACVCKIPSWQWCPWW